MIFNIFINFFEDFVLNCFLAKYFTVKNKFMFVIFGTSFSGLATTLLDTSNSISEYILLGVIFLIELILLRFFEERITFKHILCVLLGIFLIIFSNFIALSISSCIFSIEIFNIADNYNVFVYTIILSKVILVLVSFVVTRCLLKANIELQLKEWWPLILIEIIVVISLFTLGYGMIYSLSTTIIIIIMILLSGIAFFSMELSYKIHKEEKLKLNYMLESQKNIINQDTYEKLQFLKYEVIDMEHKLMYILLQIKNQTMDNNIKKIANNYIKNLSKYSAIFITDNPYFDTVICSKLNELWMEGRNFKISIFISKDPFYDQMNFVKLLLELIDLFHQISIYSCDIEISINEKNQFVVIKLISQLCNTKELELSKQVSNYIRQLNGKVRLITTANYCSIIISIDREDLENHV